LRECAPHRQLDVHLAGLDAAEAGAQRGHELLPGETRANTFGERGVLCLPAHANFLHSTERVPALLCQSSRWLAPWRPPAATAPNGGAACRKRRPRANAIAAGA